MQKLYSAAAELTISGNHSVPTKLLSDIYNLQEVFDLDFSHTDVVVLLNDFFQL